MLDKIINIMGGGGCRKWRWCEAVVQRWSCQERPRQESAEGSTRRYKVCRTSGCGTKLWLKRLQKTEKKGARKTKQKKDSFLIEYYLSKANKSLEKFIIAVYLDRRNQHYVKRVRAQQVDGWNGKQINQQGRKQDCLSPYLYLCTVYRVLDIFIVTVVVCDSLRVASSLNKPTEPRTGKREKKKNKKIWFQDIKRAL